MAPYDRSTWHDTFLYASSNPEEVLMSLWAAVGISNSKLYAMVPIILSFAEDFQLCDVQGQLVGRNDQQLAPGTYFIMTKGTISITEDTPFTRAQSQHTGGRHASFRSAVRQRDQECVISGRLVPFASVGWYSFFEAAHIFPLAFLDQWNQNNYDRFIDIPPTTPSQGKINSVQNGILLHVVMHQAFDTYQLSIDPDDNYKIVMFTPDLLDYGIAGRQLQQKFLDDPLRPPDELFRWHYRQAVLTNMKRA